MKCPADETVLQISERHGIEIDYCPTCRGVWLDRGELDKIVDRAGATTQPEPRQRGDRHDGYDRDDDRDEVRSGGRRKRGGFLGELFDI